jgi:predicted RNA-binding Zn-ribbon protein involved in translation (DUF1610 family)
MKSIQYFTQSAVRNSLLLAMAGMIWTAGAVQAQTKGGEYLARGSSLKTADVSASAPSSGMAMSCAKCKDASVTVARPQERGALGATKSAMRHQCPECASTILTEGQGKAATRTVKHLCPQCGGADVSHHAAMKGTATSGAEAHSHAQ